jgi:hypothetical protein
VTSKPRYFFELGCAGAVIVEDFMSHDCGSQRGAGTHFFRLGQMKQP